MTPTIITSIPATLRTQSGKAYDGENRAIDARKLASAITIIGASGVKMSRFDFLPAPSTMLVNCYGNSKSPCRDITLEKFRVSLAYWGGQFHTVDRVTINDWTIGQTIAYGLFFTDCNDVTINRMNVRDGSRNETPVRAMGYGNNFRLIEPSITNLLNPTKNSAVRVHMAGTGHYIGSPTPGKSVINGTLTVGCMDADDGGQRLGHPNAGFWIDANGKTDKGAKIGSQFQGWTINEARKRFNVAATYTARAKWLAMRQVDLTLENVVVMGGICFGTGLSGFKAIRCDFVGKQLGNINPGKHPISDYNDDYPEPKWRIKADTISEYPQGDTIRPASTGEFIDCNFLGDGDFTMYGNGNGPFKYTRCTINGKPFKG